MRRVVRACNCVHSQDCNSTVEYIEVEVGKKDLQLGAQVGPVEVSPVLDTIKKNSSCGHSFLVEVNQVNPCVYVWFLYVIV